MMDAKYIIADSGGSSTNWGIVLTNNEVVYVQTASLHPKYVFSEEDLLTELQTRFGDLKVPLFFYGAGCSSFEIQEKMRSLLKEIGFSQVEVFPDTLAACRALCGSEPGWVGILGTGSILIQYDGTRITKRIGGFGSFIGDEGSGFYFGKLLVRFLLDVENWESSWSAIFHSKEAILSKLASAEAQKWIASLGGLTAHLDFEFLHQQNVMLFIQNYCNQISDIPSVSLIGTYGFEQKNVVKNVFEKAGIQVLKQVASPLEDLVNFHIVNN
ncbi:BadF/BadG/BcrA/BcrD type ATPase [Fluviicola taffensis]|uniref:ATPase BadF/BadG/BcrA/BcrD type n=1 Tax=Fluviicola taffensis (strain DSM 16823 / NCIMB 13979 / RW262) TaxID=755732 RepID=F2IGX5_FLUTR|nr:BadF/BadG/BcrA/BcrD type ATPase [Fluviicola taffensis]AEA44756.1 ATPase BadF/BadG/BcrA/BcrD type [Fluviicola taffensis DSM 16823]